MPTKYLLLLAGFLATNAFGEDACSYLRGDHILQKSTDALATFRREHAMVLDTSHLPISADYLRKLYFDSSTTGPTRTGIRVGLDVFDMPPAVGIQLVARPEGAQRIALQQWAQSVLTTSRLAFPHETLRIRSIYLSVGWSAVEAGVHVDGEHFYLHAIRTVDGASTIAMQPAALKRLGFDVQNSYAASNHIYVLGNDLLGNLEVFVGQSSTDPKGKVYVLGEHEYEQPPTNHTLVMTGLERSRINSVAFPTGHSSPVSQGSFIDGERVTLFMDIGP